MLFLVAITIFNKFQVRKREEEGRTSDRRDRFDWGSLEVASIGVFRAGEKEKRRVGAGVRWMWHRQERRGAGEITGVGADRRGEPVEVAPRGSLEDRLGLGVRVREE